jgi:hypothetical protein
MKKLENVEYLGSVPVSGGLILDRDVSENVKKDYVTKNLNEGGCSDARKTVGSD